MTISKEITRKSIIFHLQKEKSVSSNKSDYELKIPENIENIKKGWNGFVLFGLNLKDQREVALKFYFPQDPEWINNKDGYNRFINEFGALKEKKLEHPRLIECLDNGEITVEGVEVPIPFYVMPRAKGSMRDLLKAKHFEKNSEFTHDFFKELGIVLQYLHDLPEEGVIHRDLKPENVLLDKNDLPILADFGIAHWPRELMEVTVYTKPSDRFYNTGYCAPEQFYGDPRNVDQRADIWAFGRILQETLTGKLPLVPTAPLPSEISPEPEPQYIALDSVILKCTKYDRKNRYQTMADCMKELNIAFSGSPKEQNQLASFYVARQEIRFLASHRTMVSQLLSERELRSLYLNRNKFTPSDQEKTVIFRNLLLRGRGKHGIHRMRKPSTGVSTEAQCALGWFWLTDLSREIIIQMVRRMVHYPNEYVQRGAVRALGKFGNSSDRQLLQNKVKSDDPNIIAECVRALAQIGTEYDIDLIRKLYDHRKSKVRESVAYVLGRFGNYEDKSILFSCLKDDEDPSVKTSALIGLGALGYRFKENPSIKGMIFYAIDKALEKPDTSGRLRPEAEKVKKLLNNEDFEELDARERYVIKQKSKYFLREDNIKSKSEKARILFSCPKLYDAQIAAVEWIIEHEPDDEIDRIINELGDNLHVRVLQQLDYLRYCPEWWRNEMDKPINELKSLLRPCASTEM